jgi:hypothetical protein
MCISCHQTLGFFWYQVLVLRQVRNVSRHLTPINSLVPFVLRQTTSSLIDFVTCTVSQNADASTTCCKPQLYYRCWSRSYFQSIRPQPRSRLGSP